jgi:predicted ArsR family transcriptional regulator
VSGISRDVWLKALADVGVNDGIDDQEAVTISEFAALIGISREPAERRLEKLAAAGAAVKTRKWSVGRDGRRVHMWAYRLKTDAPKKRKAARA